MKNALEIRGSLLLENTGLNLLGQVVPLFVALLTIPYIIHGLGVERFGILSLAWVILGYFSLVDLGLSRATTKFVAEVLGAGKFERIPQIIWTSLLVQVGLGAFGGIILAIVTPFLVENTFKIPDSLAAEANAAFYFLAFSVPVVICSSNLRGVLEASQRFDLINAVKIPLNSCAFLLPAIAVSLGVGLAGIIVLLNTAWLGSVIIYGLLNSRVFPGFGRPSFNFAYLPPLLNFAGWVTLCNVLIPILVYLDRFLIGALISVRAVAYYTAPYEVSSRLLIVPGALAATFFPAWSALSRSDMRKRNALYSRSLKYIVLLLGPFVAVATLFSREILGWWLGNVFAEESTRVFQFLAVGMLLNALTQMPANILDAIGRPDLRAKLFLAYIPVYLLMLWFLVTRYGIEGAALAWLLRSGLELILFLAIVWKCIHISPTQMMKDGLAQVLAIYSLLVAALIGARAMLDGTAAQSVATVAGLLAFGGLALRYGLNVGERQVVVSVVMRHRPLKTPIP